MNDQNSSTGWGPIPQLVAALTDFTGSSSPVAWLHWADRYGSAWGLGLHNDWPPRLRKRVPVRKYRGFWLRMRDWLRRFARDRTNSSNPFHSMALTSSDTSPNESEAHLQQLFVECESWLVVQMIPRFSRLLLPLVRGYGPPAELAACSGKGVLWSTLAFAAEQNPVLVERELERVEVPVACKLTGTDRLADLLCFHFHIEHLVQQIPNSTAWRRTAERTSVVRQPGGLRTQSFLDRYLTMRDSAATSRKVRRCLGVIHALIAHSPLTQVVYADVLSVAPQAKQWRGLGRPGVQPRGWHEQWLAQLARSIVGVMYSPPPIAEELERARRQLEALQREPGRDPRHPSWREVRAKEHVDALDQVALQQYEDRVVALAEFFDKSDGHESVAYLQCRALDMLVRSLVSHACPSLRRQWPAYAALGAHVQASRVFFDTGQDGTAVGHCFDEFLRTVLGRPVEELSRSGNCERLRNALSVLLNPELGEGSANLNPVKVASAAGITATQVRQIITRFTDNERGIELPFPYPDNRAYAPASYVARWLVALQNLLPAAKIEVTET